MAEVVRDTDAMIRGMRPELRPGTWVFCAVEDEALLPEALASFREAEGLSLILREEVVALREQLGLRGSGPSDL